MQKAQQAYLQTQITTTSQGELVVMLYDGAIKFLQQAKEKIAEKNYAEKGILISKSLDIIAELDSSLNVEKGGDLSSNLHSLYLYSQGRLLQANLKMDQGIVDEVIKILSSLRGAFAEIINSPEALKAQKQAPEQAPVNVNTFRKQLPFGMENGAESVNNAQAGPAMANNSVRAKAYQQQTVGFSAAQQGQATNFAVENKVTQQAPVTASAGAGVSVQQAGLQAAPQMGLQAGPQAKQAPKQVQEVKQPEPVVSAQAMGAAGLSGFGRQMINNSLYKKMAMAPTASPTPSVSLAEE